MKVLLINIDSKGPNLALEKIARYHRGRGDEVVWDQVLPDIPLHYATADKIYVSCLFTWNRRSCEPVLKMFPDKTICGGSGYDIRSALPAEVERVKPQINWGFTTRGCMRNCPWCIVYDKEGGLRVVGDLLDLWDGRGRNVTLLDNNILGVPEHFKLICRQARDNGIKLDFNQGLDARLLTAELAAELASIRHAQYKFAFDRPRDLPHVQRAIDLLAAAGIRQCTWYVLVGFETTLGEDLDRLNYLRDRKQAAYVMRYDRNRDRRYIALAQWANQHRWFAAMTFKQFLKRPDRPEHRWLLKEIA
jgi:hypothetical protein